MILMIDNFDSFTYNLVQYFQQLGSEVEVRRNNALTAGDALALRPEAIVLSPGPGRPAGAGIMPELIGKAAAAGIPLLGVCLGHQAIGEAFGMELVNASRIMHGKVSEITHDGRGLFAGLAPLVKVVRYHSLALAEHSLPEELAVTARSEDGEIMGIRHRTLPIEGIQYHPESILTTTGKRQLANFLDIVREHRRAGR
ncbi:aminodeoxychorismate/anthranilate synthase component II [Victivallaceae bacterium BBE-744-WT-12]|uniref:Aminodeoxychorismate/anthranilate synthase component II n=1 Tax=Victivallis lenta TaxID=2606640 RepID=A0A844GB97_9BACT|nr:aminodeoxychorismate/anthranilate synthase component II [Victivallis lenta]AVM47057.1 aminodeoxychorismate/anthranilate synthase component II [Victivallales bacterium CCUG 44730]MBS1455392.1 aminodeoxychorismate/anthranilate synthase component II [Lentisphaeria bacterium]MBS5530886.1 aminodeoxychorismate/anthranilate synthase component II [bacterium]MST99489.1 aminodeoxychorismate/anthranilate synthase component II [Victivallis lenta]HBP08609.1 aminodeoxychorismate/anthranilate synthase com